MTPPRRLVYLGSPEAAVPPLRALSDAGFEIVLVVSQPDRKRGRGAALTPTPVKAAALELGLPVSERVDDVTQAGADLGVVVAYGRLVRPHVLDALDFVNLHFSLLPRWRGAAPVERAILAGDDETGVCVMGLEEALDTGPVYACERLAVGPDETADGLRARLVEAGSTLLVRTLTGGLGEAVPQTGEATYAAKLEASDLELDWMRPAVELHRVVRIGRARTTFRGRRLKVVESRLGEATDDLGQPGTIEATTVRTGEGTLELVRVQPEGKATQPAGAWRNGARPTPGERLGG